jgi:hypothetical protein
LSVVSIPLERKYERATISQQLALQLYPQPVGGTSVTSISATLSSKDNTFHLDVPSLADMKMLTDRRERSLWGSSKPTIERVLEIIEEVSQKSY